ncbi:uncharacterized protein LOC115634782 [Scaptodrosophila lebanonensis]|uniref:Uncharacterized protein LOC115634782 n=1 Tax=Drosophila lebanonensis TaxID=7225 RepID=A0A6J2UMS8_DROLE|nr:uncharacterized protein LOC115634782 [Scaptodrosophila lebanonensis]
MKESIDVDQMLKNCSFGSRQFSCHRYFDMQLTELGPCIVFNSFLMQRNSLNEKMRRNEMFFLEETSPNWHLSFDLVGNAKDARIYMKSTTNLLSLRDKSTFTPSTEYHTTINFKIFGILNTPAVRALRPWQRKCYYSNEMFNDMKPYIRSTFYDESLCLNFCHAMLFVEKCNCLPHVYNDFFKS